MPVLSSSPPPGVPALTSSSSYLLLAGALVLLVLGTTLSRLRRHFNYLSHSSSSFSPSPSFNSSSMEKTQLVPESPSPKSSPSPSSPQYGPSSTNPPLRLPGPADPVYTSPRTSIVPLSQSLSSSSTSSSSSPSEPLVIVDLDTPRRRSYTKLTPAGTEVSGEVVVAEGWRRHTKVFGGGVCAACEENERRLAQVRSGAAAPGSFVFPPAAPPAGAQGMA